MAIDFSPFYVANFYYVAAIAYLVGCVPFALIVGYVGGIGDIRKLGSGNPGATNMARQGGRVLGTVTLLLDMGKGAAAVYLGQILNFPAAAALFVTLGHCFPIFLKFKGGKGVATTLGALLVLYPPAGLTYLGTWIFIFLVYGISSLAALIGIWATALVSLYLWFGNLSLLVYFFAVLITWRHKSNIKKLLDKTET